MGWVNCTRISTGSISLVFLVTGLGLLAAGIVSPSWLYLDIDDPQDVGSGIKEGLWIACFKNKPTSKADKQDDDGWVCGLVGSLRLDFKEWEISFRITVLGILCASFVLGFIAALLSYCGFCRKWLTIPWAAMSLLSTLLAIVGTFMFYINYQALDARKVVRDYHTREQYKHFSWGLHITVAACCCLLISFILSVPVTVLSFYYEKQKERRGYNSAVPVVSTSSSSRYRGGRDNEPLYKYEDHSGGHTTVV